MKLHKYLALLALPLLLSACVSSQTREQRAADFQAAAGAPVTSFRYTTQLYSWQPLNDHSLVVYTRPHSAWLLDVGLCPELPYTNFIGLTSTVGQVSVNFDKVLTDRHQFPCYIQKIRPIDLAKVHAAQAQRRQIKTVPRAPSASSSSH